MSLETAQIPSYTERVGDRSRTFRDMCTERAVIDFHTFWSDIMAETIALFAQTVKETTGGTKVVGAFYAYTFEFVDLAEDAEVQDLEDGGPHGDEADQQADGAEGVEQGIAEEHSNDDPTEHDEDDRERTEFESYHGCFPPFARTRTSLRKVAMPWSSSRTMPTATTIL